MTARQSRAGRREQIHSTMMASGFSQPGRRTLGIPERQGFSEPVTRILRTRQLRDESEVRRYPTREYQNDPPSKKLLEPRLPHGVVCRGAL